MLVVCLRSLSRARVPASHPAVGTKQTSCACVSDRSGWATQPQASLLSDVLVDLVLRAQMLLESAPYILGQLLLLTRR